MDLRVTGTLVPDATGIYTERGTYNGEFYYGRTDDAYYVWATGPSQWVISTLPGNPSVHSWLKNSAGVIGDYDPWLVATGIATTESYIMGWRDYLKAEWQFDENGAGTTYADSKDGLFPLTTPSPTVTSDYSVVGKFGRAFSPSLIVPVSPYVRSAVLADNELVYNEFSIRLWIQIYRILYGGGVMRRSTVAVGVTESYRIIIDCGIDEGDIAWFRVLFQISHLTEPASLIRSNKIYAGTWASPGGYYGDLLWREYLVTFKKQASTPRGHIYIDGIDVTDYAYESSHDNDVAVGTDSRIMIEGDTESDIEELRLDRLQIFNKEMVPADFIGNELVDHKLIYSHVAELCI